MYYIHSYSFVRYFLLFSIGFCAFMELKVYASSVSKGNITSNSLSTNVTDTQEHYRQFLCLFCNIQNEAMNIAEWIEYHRALGVNHFFLGDDCSSDRTVELIKNVFENDKAVTLLQTDSCNETHRGRDYTVIQKLFVVAKGECEYLMYLNVDEFISIQTDLYDGMLSDYLHEKSPIYLKLFSQEMTEGHPFLREKKLVIERFHHSDIQRRLHKTIVKTSIVTDWSNPHYPEHFIKPYESLKAKIHDVILHKNDTRYVQVPPLEVARESFIHPLLFNHYMIKSLTEYICGRGSRIFDAAGGANRWGNDVIMRFDLYSHQRGKMAIAQDFTAAMVPKVQDRLRRLREKYPKYWQFLQ